mmetsp:Transcript_23447/g.70213  ORF Transcript_23447/g.70213 Transcript_23447/m.70213 type:complete len:206 (+) Transcript_23447:121-738(+)
MPWFFTMLTSRLRATSRRCSSAQHKTTSCQPRVRIHRSTWAFWHSVPTRDISLRRSTLRSMSSMTSPPVGRRLGGGRGEDGTLSGTNLESSRTSGASVAKALCTRSSTPMATETARRASKRHGDTCRCRGHGPFRSIDVGGTSRLTTQRSTAMMILHAVRSGPSTRKSVRTATGRMDAAASTSRTARPETDPAGTRWVGQPPTRP